MLLVFRIGNGFEEFLVTGGTADVLGWTCSAGFQKPRIVFARGGLADSLNPDAVVPVIAEVVDILDRLGAGILDDLLQRCLLRGHAAVVEAVRVGHTPPCATGAELIEMGVGPAHCGLDHLVQPVDII